MARWPQIDEHSVTRVISGSRCVLSLGWVLRNKIP